MTEDDTSIVRNEEPTDVRAVVRKALAALESVDPQPVKATARNQPAKDLSTPNPAPRPQRSGFSGQPGMRRFVIPLPPDRPKPSRQRPTLNDWAQDSRGLRVWPPTEQSLDRELEDLPKGVAFGPSLPGLELTAATIAGLAKGGGDILIGVLKTRRVSGRTLLKPVGVSRKAATHFQQGLDSGVRGLFHDPRDLRFTSSIVPIGRKGQVVVAIRVFASQRSLVLKSKHRGSVTPTTEKAPEGVPLSSPRLVSQSAPSTSPRVLSADELAAYKKGLPPTREEREKRAAEIQKLLAGSPPLPNRPTSQYLDWEVLPPGEAGVERLIGGGGEWVTGRPDPRRLKFLLSLRPAALYRGSSLGQRVYIVAVFPKVAVADTGEYGNALYYYRCSDDEWMRVFRKDKQEARRAGAQRLVHTGEWEERVRRLVGK